MTHKLTPRVGMKMRTNVLKDNHLLRHNMYNMLTHEISGISSNYANVDLAKSYGLSIQNVQWEDMGRDKNSCLGPSICDLTLQSKGTKFPALRKPNFTDVTADLKLDSISATVGNEKRDGGHLNRVSLRKYIENTLDRPELLLDRDSVVLGSAQACILPLPAEESEVSFCPQIYSYQSSSDDPAVMLLLLSSQGTSVHLLNGTQQKLYFNHGGQATDMLATRLMHDRIQRGVEQSGEMTGDETDRNMLIIVQIPLKTKPRRVLHFEGRAPASMLSAQLCSTRRASSQKAGMDNAMLQAGDRVEHQHGKFATFEHMKLERDERFPLRATIQFYKVTDDSKLKEPDVADIAQKISRIYEKGLAQGSLVTGKTERVTEPEQTGRLTFPSNKTLRSLFA